ncbi:hypothetical protein HPT25_06335 [Bacillus sp. BRMEA1]|uniref:hypothetical protein n=1 Tax=Neobacillus endophyticus TaxID=2738405 RepID=UPI0015670C1C|nr:hypothetical protein [Neobacillus endophyticus]NRD77112.1 hypothetical protein [Neobacillus endophyticus]
MLIKMQRKDFDVLKRSNLSQGCFEPLIKIYKKRVADQASFCITHVKEQFYKELTDGQRALFMFYAYYNHASKSVQECYWWSAFFFAQPKSWSAIKSSSWYFDDHALFLLLEKLEQELICHHHPTTLESFSVKREDLDLNKELQSSFESLYIELGKTFSKSLKKINMIIDQKYEEFIEFI